MILTAEPFAMNESAILLEEHFDDLQMKSAFKSAKARVQNPGCTAMR